MKASELIKKLEQVIKEHGDLPVNVTVHDGDGDHKDEVCTGIVLSCDEEDKVESFLLADRETELAFA
jgi:hypothetical protein